MNVDILAAAITHSETLDYLAILDEEMHMNNTSVGARATASEFVSSSRDRFVVTVVMLASQLLLVGLGLKRRTRSDAFVQSYLQKQSGKT